MRIFHRLAYYVKFLKVLAEINGRLLYGVWRLTRLPQPAITIFGGSRIVHDSKHALMAQELARRLVGTGYSIITGGGAGIMEAANRGAIEYLHECKITGTSQCPTLVSAGIGLINLNREAHNEYVQEHIIMSHFFTRKWLLVRYAIGFVVFPGGFGTVDELFEILTLIQTKHSKKVPIILMDSHYWAPIIDWIKTRACHSDLLSEEDASLITVLDDISEAVAILSKECKGCHGQ